jgi:hypothetical protein
VMNRTRISRKDLHVVSTLLLNPSSYLSDHGTEQPKKVYSHHKVRTSLADRTLDSMFPVLNSSQIASDQKKSSLPSTPTSQLTSRYREIKESECFLTSVKSLRNALVKGKHKGGYLLSLRG